jgi:tRNA threonylcarbamoyladenosine biosynthesis protein TsaE
VITTTSSEETEQLGEILGRHLAGGEWVALHAPLGAGKTVFAKGIARALGVPDVITSPTYTIVSEYEGRLRLVHVDLYRIDGTDEFEQLAVDELAGEHSVVVIEWPERAGDALPSDTLVVTMTIRQDGSRTVALPEHIKTGEA